jgi:phytoene dehydrogenase-like protein
VIGSGVDELVAASYLARGGHEVTLLAGHSAAGDHSIEPGWIPPKIVRDLDLDRFGLEIHQPDPIVAALRGGRRLELTRDITQSAEAIRRFSTADAAKWTEFCARMHALANTLEALYTAPPPDPLTKSLEGMRAIAAAALRLRRSGREPMLDFLRIATMSAADLLDEWFESDVLKGLLGGAAIRHLAQGPRSGGTAFNMLHHHVGSSPGVFRPACSNVRSALLRRGESDVRHASAARIEVRNGRTTNVVLENGHEIEAAAVLSGLTPARTLLELIDPGLLDPELVRAIRNIRARGVCGRLSLTLDRDPGFKTLAIAPSLDDLERAYDDVKYGRASSQPYIEAHHLGTTGVARHHVHVHVQFVPRIVAGGEWDTRAAESFGRAIVARLEEHVPVLTGSIVEQHVLTPADLEHVHGFPEGQPYHAEVALDQVLWMRPVPALAQYRTPIEGLYLCGPAMHPGGGIAGAAGANAACVVLRDLKKRKA